METIKLSKNRLLLRHKGMELRIETSEWEKGFKLYFSDKARLQMPRELVIGKRKVRVYE